MSNKVTELNELKSKLLSGGGTDAINKQHADGKLTARERLERLLDKGSFIETGLFANSRLKEYDIPADGVITGYGQIDGRLIYVVAEDYTAMNGSIGEVHAEKITKCQEAAMKVGAPIVYLIDSAGFRIDEGIDALSAFGKILYNNTLASGVIPQISIIMGLCAGALTYCPALSDFVFMIDKVSKMFITGPQVISSKSGNVITADELGGASIHSKLSGVAHFKAQNEDMCIAQVKSLISFLPQNYLERAEVVNCSDDLNRVSGALNDLGASFDVKSIVVDIADNNYFLETQSEFATNIVTGFIRLGGRTVGIVANQSIVKEGLLDNNSSDKAARFIRTCDAFNIPILTIEDAKGFVADKNEEHNGLIRHFSKVIYAYSESTVPMITLIVDNAYGSAYIGMCSKYVGADLVYAWPNAKIGIMSSEAAVSIVYENEIKSSNNPDKERENKINEYNDKMMNPYIAASGGYIDDIIEPSNTRKILISAFDNLSTKSVHKVNKKHGNMPL